DQPREKPHGPERHGRRRHRRQWRARPAHLPRTCGRGLSRRRGLRPKQGPGRRGHARPREASGRRRRLRLRRDPRRPGTAPGLGPTGSSIAYAVSKAGLIHLTTCMAVALAPEVLVNCVAPGLLEGTRATANLRPEQVESGRKLSLLGKAADKDDVADQVVTM